MSSIDLSEIVKMYNYFNNSLIVFPSQAGHKVKYNKFKHPKITELLGQCGIKTLKDFTNEKNRGILTKEIIEKLFVKDFLSRAILSYGKIVHSEKNQPDFRLEIKKKIAVTIEVYTPLITKKVLDKSMQNIRGTLVYRSTIHPLHSDMITNKINKYSVKYPDSKQCLFIFFVDYLNEKNLMRAFRNFYGDTLHSNGALAHNGWKETYCIKREMERVAGFFLSEGHVNIKEGTLEYGDVIFTHNPFCEENYKIPLTFFNANLVFQSYIQFLGSKPSRDEWWGNFLVRFYQNKYPGYLFLKEEVDYCKQLYPEIVQVGRGQIPN